MSMKTDQLWPQAKQTLVESLPDVPDMSEVEWFALLDARQKATHIALRRIEKAEDILRRLHADLQSRADAANGCLCAARAGEAGVVAVGHGVWAELDEFVKGVVE